MLQGRITSELRLAQAADIDSANAVLRQFIADYNRRFSFAGAKVHIYQALDGRISLYYGDTRLQHLTVSGGVSFMLLLG